MPVIKLYGLGITWRQWNFHKQSPNHTGPEQIENSIFTLKTHIMFFIPATLDKFEKRTGRHFGFVFKEKTRVGKSHVCRDPGGRGIGVHGFSNISRLKSVFEELRFQRTFFSGLVMTDAKLPLA